MEPIHFKILPGETRQTFLQVGKLSMLSSFYLAGGTAVALYLAHRLSDDLDFFSQDAFDESMLVQRLSETGNFTLEQKSEHTVTGVFNGTKVTFLSYIYPLLEPLKTASRPEFPPRLRARLAKGGGRSSPAAAGFPVADLLDIACMKVDAISSRGTKRDFIDVYFIAQQHIPVSSILKNFEKKYASVHYNMIHVKKSLVYFEDAESDPMPKMLKPVRWKDVKRFFKKEIVKLE